MALSAKTGTLSTTTAAPGNTVVVSGLGFQPSAIVLWWTGGTDTANACARGSHFQGWGFATSTTDRRAVTATSLDAAAASDGGSYHTDAACILSCTHAGAIDGALDLQSMDADGFTLVVDDAMPRNQTVGYLAIGGSTLTNVATGQFTSPTVAGSQDVTTVGFQPDCLLFIGTANDTAPPDAQASTAVIAFGAAVSSSQQAAWAGSQDDGSATMDAGAYCLSGECIATHTGSSGVALGKRASLTSMLSNGFRLNWITAAAVAHYTHFLALKGGNYRVDGLTTQTDTTTAMTETGFGFAPIAAMLVSACRAESTAGTPTAHNALSIGASHSTTARHAFGLLDEDAVADSEVTLAYRTDAVYANISTASAIEGLMDVQSFDSDGFTTIMDDADPSGSFVWYLAVGAPSGSAADTIAGSATVSGAGSSTAAATSGAAAGQATTSQVGASTATTTPGAAAGQATTSQVGASIAATVPAVAVGGATVAGVASSTAAAVASSSGAAVVALSGSSTATAALVSADGVAATSQVGASTAVSAPASAAGAASVSAVGSEGGTTSAADVVAAAGVASVTGTASSTATATADAALGLAAASSAGASTVASTATLSGLASVAGIGSSTAATAATPAAGVATVSVASEGASVFVPATGVAAVGAAGSSVAAASGSAAGVATAASIGAAVFAASGVAGGVAVASLAGSSIAAAAMAASGLASTSAIAASTAAALIDWAMGTATVSANAPTGDIVPITLIGRSRSAALSGQHARATSGQHDRALTSSA